jgi:predicted transposase YbfD/YdcC
MEGKENVAMENLPKISLQRLFEDMDDPRVVGRCTYRLTEVVLIAMCGVLSGAESWTEIEEFGESKRAWLATFLRLEQGIPSHDTFRRVFSLLPAEVFESRFREWVETTFRVESGQVIAIDGKTVGGAGVRALHLVSAWAHQNGIVLGQRKVDEKSNEITAIPQLLDDLYLAGSIVTLDAMGTQTKIAQKIIDKHADYVLALKGNHGQLHTDVAEWFAWATERQFQNMPHTFAQTLNKNHGRIEIRQCWALSDPHAFEVIRHHDGWAGLQSIIMVKRQRRLLDNTPAPVETVYFLSSLPADAQLLLHAIRAHWAIENNFHWTLDVVFHEDDARLRVLNGPENFAILRHFALNLLKRHPAQLSLRRKPYKAALDDTFLSQLLHYF